MASSVTTVPKAPSLPPRAGETLVEVGRTATTNRGWCAAVGVVRFDDGRPRVRIALHIPRTPGGWRSLDFALPAARELVPLLARAIDECARWDAEGSP